MENKLQKCYIWDIDGTIAQRINRSPFDYTKVSTDIPKANIQTLYQHIYTSESEFREQRAMFFFITGRDESCRKETEEWLKKYNFRHDGLFMRLLGRRDIDATIKLKHYKEHIQGKYEVIAVFEDQNRCVELYKNHLKLTCLQVDNGKF